MSDKNPGEKLGTSSHSNSMCSDRTLGYEDEKTDAGTFVCIFYCDWNRFVVHFKTAIYIFTCDVWCMFFRFRVESVAQYKWKEIRWCRADTDSRFFCNSGLMFKGK